MELELLDFEIEERKRLAALKKARADGALAKGPMGKGAKKEEKDKKPPKTRDNIVRAANTKRELLQIESSDRLGLRFYKARHSSRPSAASHLNHTEGSRGVIPLYVAGVPRHMALTGRIGHSLASHVCGLA